MRGGWLPAVVVLALGTTATIAGETSVSYGLEFGVGFDRNPLEVSVASPNPEESGAFTHLRLDGSFVATLNSSVGFFSSGSVRTRLHDSGTSDADYAGGELRVGFSLSPVALSRRLMISAGAGYTAFRGTFVDHLTGHPYLAFSVPATTPATLVPIPDRLDSNTGTLFLNARWRQNERWSFFCETSGERTNFVEDYDAGTDLDPLDYELVRIRPGVNVRFNSAVAMTVSVSVTDLDYTERPALDDVGAAVAGTLRSYRYTQYQASLSVRPADRWSLGFSLAGGGRDDVYAGYYDSASRGAYVSLGRELGQHGVLRLSASARDLDYDRATISGQPDGEVNENDVQRYLARYEHDINRRTRWFVEGGTQTSDSRDPVFTYDRDWVYTGIQFRR